MKKRKIKHSLGLVCLNAVFIIVCFITLVPVLYAFLLSVSDGSSAFAGNLFGSAGHFTLENYKRILTEEPFLLWLKNSVVLSLGTTVLAIGFATTASYAFPDTGLREG